MVGAVESTELLSYGGPPNNTIKSLQLIDVKSILGFELTTPRLWISSHNYLLDRGPILWRFFQPNFLIFLEHSHWLEKFEQPIKPA